MSGEAKGPAPVVDPWLLDRFQAELGYLTESAQAFGREHEDAAKFLTLSGSRITDPYVGYLMDGVAFLAARVRLKIEDEFPTFVEQMLNIVAPQLLASTPSMAVIAFEPDFSEPSLQNGSVIEAGAGLEASPPRGTDGSAPSCKFRTGRAVTLRPVAVAGAEYVTNRARLADYAEAVAQGLDAAAIARLNECPAAVRVVFEIRGPAAQSASGPASLGIEHLDVYLADERGGEGDLGRRLFDALCGRCVGGLLVPGGEDPRKAGVPLPPPIAIAFDDPALLEGHALDASGHRYLQEYFACPERFQFARFGGLDAGLAHVQGAQFEVVYLLSAEDKRLSNAVLPRNFVLHAAPVINLFQADTQPVDLQRQAFEYEVSAGEGARGGVEIVRLLSGQVWCDERRYDLNAYPIYERGAETSGRDRVAYFQQRRQSSRLTYEHRTSLGRDDSNYESGDVYISMVGLEEPPAHGKQWTNASFTAWCCNGDHPLRIVGGAGPYDMDLVPTAPIVGIRLVRGATKPRSPLRYVAPADQPMHASRGEWYWRALNHLSANYTSLTDAEDGRPTGLRDLLGVYGFIDPDASKSVLAAIRSVSDAPIVRRLKLDQRGDDKASTHTDFARAYPVRGRRVSIVVEEGRLSRGGVFILGGVLSRFLAEYATVNSFVETELRDLEGRLIGLWPARQGERRTL